METLCNHLLDTHNRHYTSKYMIYTALLTGARLGELQALTWDDINPQFKTITINKAWYKPARRFKSTKNESSKRIIRVNQQLINVLSELRGKDMVFATPFPLRRLLIRHCGNVCMNAELINRVFISIHYVIRM